MDFLPSSITSIGGWVNFAFRTNSTTYFVSPGVCGNGAGAQVGISLAPSVAGDKPTVGTMAPKLAEDRKKSRLFMAAKYPLSSEATAGLLWLSIQPCRWRTGLLGPAGRAGRPSLHRAAERAITGCYFFPTAITTNEFGNGRGRPRGFSGLGFGAGPRSADTVSIWPVAASKVMVRAPFLVGTFSISVYFPSRSPTKLMKPSPFEVTATLAFGSKAAPSLLSPVATVESNLPVFESTIAMSLLPQTANRRPSSS